MKTNTEVIKRNSSELSSVEIKALAKQSEVGLVVNNKPVRINYPVRQTIRDVVTKNDQHSHRLIDLARELGVEKVLSLLKLYLVDLDESLNLKRGLSPQLIDKIAKSILDNFPKMHLSGVAFILNNAKTGVYGEFYESINQPKILKWFRDYELDRIDVKTDIFEEKYNNIRGEERAFATRNTRGLIQRLNDKQRDANEFNYIIKQTMKNIKK